MDATLIRQVVARRSSYSMNLSYPGGGAASKISGEQVS